MENINKENFFNEMIESYPLAMGVFSKFIDDQKKQLNWNRIFNPKFFSIHVSGSGSTELTNDDWPKFHDLPYPLQLGLFIKFLNDVKISQSNMFHGFYLDELLEVDRMKTMLKVWFRAYEAENTPKKPTDDE